MSLVDTLLSGATVTLETTLCPPIDVSLAPDNSPPGLLARLVRPKVVVRENGRLVVAVAPAGEPSEAPPYGMMILLTVAVLFFALLMRYAG